MDENNLYYRRGIHIIDKLLKKYTNDSTFYKKRLELLKSEIQRFDCNKDLMVKDINSLYITAMVALFGLNKENIEKMDKHENYNLFKLIKEKKKTTKIDSFYEQFPSFINDRIEETNFDDWLSVQRCDYPTQSYMMNVRNALLHSEYEILDNYGDLLEVNNSNYTHFKAQICLYAIMDFCLFYFGNNAWTGLSEKFTLCTLDSKIKAKTEEDVKKILKELEIINVNYKLKYQKDNIIIPETKAYDFVYNNINSNKSIDEFIYSLFGKKYEYETAKSKLTENKIDIIVKMIEKYYGDSFYNLKEEEQQIQLMALSRYLTDSRGTISEWICDYVDFYNLIYNIVFRNDKKYSTNIDLLINDIKGEDNKRSVFACKTSLLILKLYHTLYRLQNKKYERIDYNNIDFDLSDAKYNYTRTDMDGSITTDFEIDKAKLKLKDATSSDKELSNKVVCDIIRNSLCHGNIEMSFKIENDELVESVVFEDSYHSKTRKLEITIEKLEKFLNSEAFLTKNCIMKSSSGKVL